MTPLFEFAARIQEFCRQHHWRFCFIGGIPVQRWAEPRLTRDVDLTLLTGFGNEEPYVDAWLKRFPGRIPHTREFALERRVLLLTSPERIDIDVALAGLPFEESVGERATDFPFLPAVSLHTCSAEDLIVLKSFAARPLDWHDVRMTIVRQGEGKIDWTYIVGQLKPLAEAKEQPEIVDQLLRLRRDLRQPTKRPGQKHTPD